MRNVYLVAAVAIAACRPAGVGAPVRAARTIERASTQPWRSLAAQSNWRGYASDSIPNGWTFADGTISKTRGARDLMTRDEFGNFELELDWKIGKGGNSGIFYRGTTEYDHIYWSGPEYQLLDDANAEDNKSALTRAGADYGLYPTVDGHSKPFGEWNHARIVVNGNHVEHWLNGFQLLEYELNSADWKAKVSASKFKDWPHYGLAPKGHIGIQGDHPGTLEIRDIRIRELP